MLRASSPLRMAVALLALASTASAYATTWKWINGKCYRNGVVEVASTYCKLYPKARKLDPRPGFTGIMIAMLVIGILLPLSCFCATVFFFFKRHRRNKSMSHDSAIAGSTKSMSTAEPAPLAGKYETPFRSDESPGNGVVFDQSFTSADYNAYPPRSPSPYAYDPPNPPPRSPTPSAPGSRRPSDVETSALAAPGHNASYYGAGGNHSDTSLAQPPQQHAPPSY